MSDTPEELEKVPNYIEKLLGSINETNELASIRIRNYIVGLLKEIKTLKTRHRERLASSNASHTVKMSRMGNELQASERRYRNLDRELTIAKRRIVELESKGVQ